MKKYFFLSIAVLIIASCCFSLKAQNYSQKDSAALVKFLNAPSVTSGITNGQQINANYASDDMSTWLLDDWTYWSPDINGDLRLEELLNYTLWADTLDLTQCDSITYIEITGSKISKLKVSNLSKLQFLFCENNQLEELDLTGDTSLSTLRCNNNFISQLNIRDCKNLGHVNASTNNLTFNSVILPLDNNITYSLFGLQRPFVPREVIDIGNSGINNYVSRGFSIDFGWLGGTNFNWTNNTLGAAMTSPSDYSQLANDVFIFVKHLFTNQIVCEITNSNTEYGNLRLQSVPFVLTYKYNENDSLKIRTFLDIKLAGSDATNGSIVNPSYEPKDPATYMVTWEPMPKVNPTEFYVTDIDWENIGIEGTLDIAGIPYLTDIFVNNNKLTGIYFGTSPNDSIKRVYCSNNSIVSLDLTKLSGLMAFNCNNNSIDSLDISKNSKLQLLNCDNNKITKIELPTSPNLIEVNCENNLLTSLDVAKLTFIERITCSNNYISKLNTKNLSKLSILHADNNRIDSINLVNSLDLISISVRNNGLKYLNMAGLNKVNDLKCDNNKLDFNSLIMPSNTISTSSNFLVLYPQDTVGREAFDKLNDTTYIAKAPEIDLSAYISNYDKTYFNWYLFDGTNSILLAKDNLTGKYTPSENYNGKSIYCKITTESKYYDMVLVTPMVLPTYIFNDHDVAQLRKFLNTYSKFGTIQNGKTNGVIINPNYNSNNPNTFAVTWKLINGEQRVTEINWENQIYIKGDLDLSGCNELVNINISNIDNLNRNAVVTLNLENCTNLAYVDASFNQIADLNINNDEKLVRLNCSDNVIDNAIIIMGIDIKNINLSNNKIPSIAVTHMPNLAELNVSGNKLSALSLTRDSSLVRLFCANNDLFELDLSHNEKLTQLDFSNNDISTINLEKHIYLQGLYCANNELSDIDILNCKELIALDCSGNNLIELNVAEINYITYLKADNNKLNFVNINYDYIPNETFLHPQAMLIPSNIDVNNVLTSDELDLRSFCNRNDSKSTYVIKYIDGTEVDETMYTFADGLYTKFNKELANNTFYCEITNPKYPGLVLSTIRFNTIASEKYNSNDVNNLRAFLNQTSNANGLTNGIYLTSSYNSDAPQTFPVTWKQYENELRVVSIVWNNKSLLNGNLTLTNCTFLDTLWISGNSSQNNSLASLNVDGCDSLSYMSVTYGALKGLILSNLNILKTIDVLGNQLVTLDLLNIGKVNNLNCSFNKLAELNLLNNSTINILNCSNNNLNFNTLLINNRPNVFVFVPQSNIVPSALKEISNDDYSHLLQQNQIDLSPFGNPNEITYEWYSVVSPTNINKISIAGNNGVFYVSDEFDLLKLRCVLINNQNKFKDFYLTTVDFLADLHTNIEDALNPNVALYPNPASNYTTISLNLNNIDNCPIKISVYGIDGNELGTIYDGFYAREIQLNTNTLSTGTYYLKINSAEQQFIKMLNIQR